MPKQKIPELLTIEVLTDRNLLFSGAAAEVGFLGEESKLEASIRRFDDFCAIADPHFGVNAYLALRTT